MDAFLNSKERSVVKIFINTLSLLVFFHTSLVAGQVTSQLVVDPDAKCNRLRDEFKQANIKLGEACKKAGLSTADCINKSKQCAEVASSDSFSTMDAFAMLMTGAPAGSLDGMKGGGCPQYSGRDYFTDRKDLEKEMKDTSKDLANLNDEQAKIQEAYNKDIQDFTESFNKAQEKLNETTHQLEQDERDRLAQFMQSQSQAKEDLRKKGADILRLRGQLIQSQRDKALKMIAMTEASGKRACMKAVAESRKNYESLGASTNSNHIQNAKKKKQDLINTYNDCMDAFDQQRMALMESKKQEQEDLTKQINNLQSSVDEIQNSMNLASTQLEEIKQATAKKKNEAVESVMKLGVITQDKMSTAAQKLNTNKQTIAAKIQNHQGELNRANIKLMSMGPVPPKGSEISVASARSEIDSQIEILSQIAVADGDKKCGVKDNAQTIIDRYREKKQGTR
jgi:DNA repair exonuclease SbcCD ATPase subunit